MSGGDAARHPVAYYPITLVALEMESGKAKTTCGAAVFGLSMGVLSYVAII
jgi:hypothetical protein